MGKQNKIKHNQPPKKQQPKAKVVEIFSFEKEWDKKAVYIVTVIVCLIAFFVYRNFLLMKDTFMYNDIGSDTVNYLWPHYASLSEYIRKYGLPKWSFSQGMGQNIYPFSIGDPFSFITCLLPREAIPYAFGYFEVIKIILSGFLFYLLLKSLNFSKYTTVIGGVIYAFSGYMILGSCWYWFSTEALYGALALYCAQRFLKDGIWYLLPIPFFLIAIDNAFMLYLYGIAMVMYCGIWVVVSEGYNWKKIAIKVFQIGALAVFGALMGSILLFSDVQLLAQNPRSSGDTSLFSRLSGMPIFGFSPKAMITSSIYRLFSNDMQGVGSNFKGYSNYLESPILYIGLPTLLLAPQAFMFMEKRKRNFFLALTAVAILPIIFMYFRFMFWAFSGDYFRTYSFFVSLLLLFLALKAVNMIDKESKLSIIILIVTLIVLLILLYYPYYKASQEPVIKNTRDIAAFLLCVYTIIIYMSSKANSKKYAMIGLLVVLGSELFGFSNTTINKRDILPASDLKERKGYNDSTLEVLKYIEARDTSFYRIDKDYLSSPSKQFSSLNGALMQHYKGTQCYIEFNQNNYINFLNDLNVYSVEGKNSRWIYAFPDRPLLETVSNVKYVIASQPNTPFATYGYRALTKIGRLTIFENQFYLPFGFSYHKFIRHSEFMKMSNTPKDIMLSEAMVVDDKDAKDYEGFTEVFAKDSVIQTKFTGDEYMRRVKDLAHDSLHVSYYNDNHIEGTANMDEKRLLYFSIPFDKGWTATVDGKPAELKMVNIGFTGLILDKGMHKVELNFYPPLVKQGAVVSLVTMALYILALVGFRKRKF